MSVILTNWEAEIRSVTVQGQPQENSSQEPVSRAVQVEEGRKEGRKKRKKEKQAWRL
jgi:hypothetical protein